MTGFAILDVAVGLLLVYLVLSLIATSFGEIIATLFHWRADPQFKAVRSFIGERDTCRPKASHIYQSTEIQALRESKPGGKQKDSAYMDSDVLLGYIFEEGCHQPGSIAVIQKRRIATFVGQIDGNEVSHSHKRIRTLCELARTRCSNNRAGPGIATL